MIPAHIQAYGQPLAKTLDRTGGPFEIGQCARCKIHACRTAADGYEKAFFVTYSARPFDTHPGFTGLLDDCSE